MRSNRGTRNPRLLSAVAAGLRHGAVAAGLLLAAAGCGGSGSGGVLVYLVANAACFGTGIEVAGLDDAAASGVACELGDELAGTGCTVGVEGVGDALRISVRGCFTDPGQSLLRCSGPAGFEEALRGSATVRCGCGCAEQCPEAPAVAVCREGDDDCAMQAAVAARVRVASSGPHTVGHGIAQVTTTSSSTTSCGTCCDVLSDPDVYLESATVLSELEFEVYVPSNEPRCPDISCAVDPDILGPVSYRTIDDEHLRICMASPSGLAGPRPVAYCGVQSDDFDDLLFVNVRGLDADWKPVDPPPQLSSVLF